MQIGQFFGIFRNFFRLFLVLLGGYIMLLEIGMAISESHVLKYISSWFILLEMCGIGIALLIIGGIKLINKEAGAESQKRIKARNKKYRLFFILLGIYIVILNIYLTISGTPLTIDFLTVFFPCLGIFFIIMGTKIIKM